MASSFIVGHSFLLPLFLDIQDNPLSSLVKRTFIALPDDTDYGGFQASQANSKPDAKLKEETWIMKITSKIKIIDFRQHCFAVAWPGKVDRDLHFFFHSFCVVKLLRNFSV